MQSRSRSPPSSGFPYRTPHYRAREAAEITEGDPHREPEALYFTGVADYKLHYKLHKDANQLMAAWNRLLDQCPQSEWAKKAAFIRQK